MKKLAYTFAVVTTLFCSNVGNVRSAVEAEKPQLETDKKTEKLLDRIAQLEKRVAELEKLQLPKITQMHHVETYLPSGAFPLKPQSKYQVDVRNLPKPNAYPRGWKQKQINGMKYFIVPLSLPQ